jgi:endo-1,4-beta-xylanase
MVKITARDRLKLLGGAGAFVLSGCGGGGSSPSRRAVIPPLAPPVSNTPPPVPDPTPVPTPEPIVTGQLRDYYRNQFPVGVAIRSNQITSGSRSAAIAVDQFSSVTPEYELKLDQIAPTAGTLNFDAADRIVDWALANNMTVRGHTLLWHLTTPDYFLAGTPTEIRQRLDDYIGAVVTHFRGRIAIWDVVNEVVSDDIYSGAQGIGPDRRSNWYTATGGADYIDWAFRAARAADPSALLFLNEYETEITLKGGWLLDILRRLVSNGTPIDGVGHQFHLNLRANAADALTAIDMVDNAFLGLINHVTEVDTNFYQDPGTCWESQTNCQPDIGLTPPTADLATQAQLLRDLMTGLAARPSVKNVSFWGVTDRDSWLNTTPVTRSNHPLLFDRAGEPKPAFYAITDPDYVIGG